MVTVWHDMTIISCLCYVGLDEHLIGAASVKIEMAYFFKASNDRSPCPHYAFESHLKIIPGLQTCLYHLGIQY